MRLFDRYEAPYYCYDQCKFSALENIINENLSSLRKLDLTGIDIGAEPHKLNDVVNYLSTKLQKDIHSIIFSNCNLSSLEVANLDLLLSSLPEHIKEIDLSKNDFSLYKLEEFMQLMQKLTLKYSIILDDNELGKQIKRQVNKNIMRFLAGTKNPGSILSTFWTINDNKIQNNLGDVNVLKKICSYISVCRLK